MFVAGHAGSSGGFALPTLILTDVARLCAEVTRGYSWVTRMGTRVYLCTQMAKYLPRGWKEYENPTLLNSALTL